MLCDKGTFNRTLIWADVLDVYYITIKKKKKKSNVIGTKYSDFTF